VQSACQILSAKDFGKDKKQPVKARLVYPSCILVAFVLGAGFRIYGIPSAYFKYRRLDEKDDGRHVYELCA
jgi:hypothetical protein